MQEVGDCVQEDVQGKEINKDDGLKEDKVSEPFEMEENLMTVNL